jgi:hypothetical protein
MDTPHMPLGLLGKIWQWLKDFALMPGRIRVIAVAAQADADKRPICTACGLGRVSVTGREKYGYEFRPLGTCGNCGIQWAMSNGGAGLDYPLTDTHYD